MFESTKMQTKLRTNDIEPTDNISFPIGTILLVTRLYGALNFGDIFGKHKTRGIDINGLLQALISYKLAILISDLRLIPGTAFQRIIVTRGGAGGGHLLPAESGDSGRYWSLAPYEHSVYPYAGNRSVRLKRSPLFVRVLGMRSFQDTFAGKRAASHLRCSRPRSEAPPASEI